MVPLLMVSQISNTVILPLAVYGSTEINSDTAFVINKKSYARSTRKYVKSVANHSQQ